VKLIYATSRLDDCLGRIFLPALGRLLDEAGPRIEAHFWGPRPPAELRAVRHHAVVHDYDRFLRRFSAAGFEIGLAPLADDVFHRSKTNTKFREYGACGIAGVYSDVEVYSDCVRQGETGLLVANDTDAWYGALRQLVDDAPLRRTISQQARAEIEAHYSQEQFEAVFLRQIEQLVGAGRPRQTITTEPSDRLPPAPCRTACTPGQGRARMARLARLIPQALGHLRRAGWARCWNTLRWMGSSSWSMAWLQWRLRK
jgi:hypothetical protein